LDRVSEDYVREMVLQCWLEAYTAGLERGLKALNHEDMGR
jgi:hypothetical protein